MNDCIFCTKANGDVSELVWHNEQVAAFKTIDPKAPVHLLVVPKRHVATLQELDDTELAGALLMAVREVASQAGIASAYRIHVNSGKGAGQVIDHLHFHVLGRFSDKELQGLREEGM